jgi:dienelactone hydrolase
MHVICISCVQRWQPCAQFLLRYVVGVRAAAFDALSKAVEAIVARGVAPKRVVVAGFSMGGGVGT